MVYITAHSTPIPLSPRLPFRCVSGGGLMKSSAFSSAVHSPDRTPVWSTALPAASFRHYSLQLVPSFSRRMYRRLKLVYIRVNRSYGFSCTGTRIHSGLSRPMIMSTGPAAWLTVTLDQAISGNASLAPSGMLRCSDGVV